jgi:hypothetical protein
MIYYLSSQRLSGMMQSFLATTWGARFRDLIQIITYESILAGNDIAGRPGGYIFSSISDMRRLRPEERAAIADLHRRLTTENGVAKVLNDPLRSLTRYPLLRALHDQGINTFTAYRLDEPVLPIRFPVIIRREFGTEHQPLPLVESASDYFPAVAAFKWLRGRVDDLIAVEFCETADAKGMYRKYGAFVIGQHILPRHLFFSEDWMVKQAEVIDPETVEEEFRYLGENPHADFLLDCARVANISYGRIDYAVLNGRPQIWEINTSVAIMSDQIQPNPARHRTYEKFVSMLDEAFSDFNRPAG